MLPSFAVGLRACCVAVALLLATAYAADPKPFIGATRQQVLDRLGEPKSAIVAGNREVLFFARDRLVLRDGVVVEYEALPAEPARRPAPAGEASAPPATAAPPAATDQPGAAAPGAAQPPAAEPTPPAATPTPRPASETSTRIEIKSVRRPNDPVRPEESAPVTPAPAPVVAPKEPPKAAVKEKATVPTPIVAPKATEPASLPSTQTRTVRAPTPPPEATPEEKALEEAAAAENAKKNKAKASSIRRRMADASFEGEEPFFSTNTIILALVLVGGGIVLIAWQVRQRRLALAATAVSRTPFNTPVGGVSTLRFTPELLAKLEWKRFEELVCSYYSKTGVVAARTKAGPGKPVQIKISWKGEPRPFAYVQCLPQADGLIDAAPIMELVTALNADDIRRGYIVTTGKFSVNARDLAEEKHITLLPGDIFLEKLNALPDAARAELMQETKAGDYTTPSCPKCEAKMVKVGDEPGVFKCAAHPDQVIKVPVV